MYELTDGKAGLSPGGNIAGSKAELAERAANDPKDAPDLPTAGDFVDAAIAEAALTPDTADDIAAASGAVGYWESQLAAARASGDPRLGHGGGQWPEERAGQPRGADGRPQRQHGRAERRPCGPRKAARGPGGGIVEGEPVAIRDSRAGRLGCGEPVRRRPDRPRPVRAERARRRDVEGLMANPLLEFDPTSEDAANSPLEIWNTTSYAVSAFSAPAPPLTVQWASSVDTEGSLPSSKKHENRTISITVDVLSAAALRSLQAKIGKVTREGGTLKLTLPASSEVVVFDLHSADTFEPQLDIVYFVNSGAFCTVNLSLTAKPYGRGPSVTLSDAHERRPRRRSSFTETGIKGDMPALGTLSDQNECDRATNDVRALGHPEPLLRRLGYRRPVLEAENWRSGRGR
jgi:hypothetical protein